MTGRDRTGRAIRDEVGDVDTVGTFVERHPRLATLLTVLAGPLDLVRRRLRDAAVQGLRPGGTARARCSSEVALAALRDSAVSAATATPRRVGPGRSPGDRGGGRRGGPGNHLRHRGMGS